MKLCGWRGFFLRVQSGFTFGCDVDVFAVVFEPSFCCLEEVADVAATFSFVFKEAYHARVQSSAFRLLNRASS